MPIILSHSPANAMWMSVLTLTESWLTGQQALLLYFQWSPTHQSQATKVLISLSQCAMGWLHMTALWSLESTVLFGMTVYAAGFAGWGSCNLSVVRGYEASQYPGKAVSGPWMITKGLWAVWDIILQKIRSIALWVLTKVCITACILILLP